jgi:hypothetical protein
MGSCLVLPLVQLLASHYRPGDYRTKMCSIRGLWVLQAVPRLVERGLSLVVWWPASATRRMCRLVLGAGFRA